jgi:hypothetical protein
MGEKLGRGGGFTHNNLVQTKTHVKSILFLLSIISFISHLQCSIICACRFSICMLRISCIYAYIYRTRLHAVCLRVPLVPGVFRAVSVSFRGQ